MCGSDVLLHVVFSRESPVANVTVDARLAGMLLAMAGSVAGCCENCGAFVSRSIWTRKPFCSRFTLQSPIVKNLRAFSVAATDTVRLRSD